VTDRAALLALDCCAFEWSLRNAPVIAYRCGHFAVFRTPEGFHVVGPSGEPTPLLPWSVAHVASQTACLDFATADRAWQFGDEISRACGERLDHEPRDARAFCAAVPDVVAWVQDIATQKLMGGDRLFYSCRDFQRWKRTGVLDCAPAEQCA
jgi:hypothetical protein